MPRSFLIKKKRQNAFKMDSRKDEILNSNMQSLPQNSEDVVHRGHSLSNKNEATEPKFSNFQAPYVEEKSLETKYSIYFQIPHNLDFSQSNGRIPPANERSLQYLSATMAEERNSARKKLMERGPGADLDEKESLLLPSVVKMEASDYEDGVQNVIWERNNWQSSFVNKSVHEDLNTQPMCHHSEVKMGSKETTLIYEEKNKEDFEVSAFLHAHDAGGTLKREETVHQDIRYPTPSSSSEEGVKKSMFSSKNATEVSALQQKSPKASGSSSRKYRYTCDVCGKSFSRSNTLTTHRRIHTGDKPFICEQCGRAFRQPGNLTRHRLTHTTVKPYVCLQCNKAFNRASNLHTHMRTHTNYKPFVCEFCGKGFHQKIDMKIHRYTHTGEKPHKCDKCGRGFKQLTHLTYHLRTHSEMRLYQCEYCGKGFNQKGNLQAHIYGHTGERPFKCQVCGKGFTLASTLNTHKRTHASKKPFQCQFCTKAFYQKNALKTHYIASHPFANGISIL